jgi:hypothetical protein
LSIGAQPQVSGEIILGDALALPLPPLEEGTGSESMCGTFTAPLSMSMSVRVVTLGGDVVVEIGAFDEGFTVRDVKVRIGFASGSTKIFPGSQQPCFRLLWGTLELKDEFRLAKLWEIGRRKQLSLTLARAKKRSSSGRCAAFNCTCMHNRNDEEMVHIICTEECQTSMHKRCFQAAMASGQLRCPAPGCRGEIYKIARRQGVWDVLE